MSLDWNATNVANFDSLKEENWSYIEVVIFDTMAVGINKLTKDNVGEFSRRQLVARSALGYSYQELKEFHEACNEEFLTKLVGLTTNASSLTPTAFNKKLIANIESRVYGIRRDVSGHTFPDERPAE